MNGSVKWFCRVDRHIFYLHCMHFFFRLPLCAPVPLLGPTTILWRLVHCADELAQRHNDFFFVFGLLSVEADVCPMLTETFHLNAGVAAFRTFRPPTISKAAHNCSYIAGKANAYINYCSATRFCGCSTENCMEKERIKSHFFLLSSSSSSLCAFM